MLTLEQVVAVNHGFHRGDLNAALEPLEETIDLRANELPRLDKKAVAALKQGLKNGDDAATWAQAVLHPNVSVRRFARKVLLPLGDEAAPLFVPLRARLERFWVEEEPLPESNQPREAALRREQNEQVESALELLLRCDPEAFLAFYAELADKAPEPGEMSPEMIEWRDRSSKAWEATAKESDRLLEAEWGKKWLDANERWKLPSRVLRELDERARAKPEVAALWEGLTENPWDWIAPAWNPADSLMKIWSGSLSQCKPSGPVRRINERLRAVLLGWLEVAFDAERAMSERELAVRRPARGHFAFYVGIWLGQEIITTKVPALLVQSKPPLLGSLQIMGKRGGDFSFFDVARRKGKHLLASLWLTLASTLANSIFKPYYIDAEDWQMPDLDPALFRELAADLPGAQSGRSTAAALLKNAKILEDARENLDSETSRLKADLEHPEVAPVAADKPADPLFCNLASVLGYYSFDALFEKVKGGVVSKVEALKGAFEALDDQARIAYLVRPSRLPNRSHILARGLCWEIWASALGDEGEAELKSALWPRAEPQLWARFEQQLQAHRKLETEAIEPDVKRKLTEREAKAWRSQVRAQKRGVIAADVHEIAQMLMHVDGLPAQLKAIELADRPSCREVRDQLERKLFYQLEEFPSQFRGATASADDWQNWKLGAEWDAVLERAGARLADAKDEWTRNVLTRELAIGYYRRGDFARFESYLAQPESFPYAVAVAAVHFDDFAAWQALVTRFRGGYPALEEFWQAQQRDNKRRARAFEVVVQTLATANDDFVGKTLLKWLAPLDAAEFAPHLSDVENALESPLANVKKWAMSILGQSPDADFDREQAAQTASESLWSENAGLAKDAAKFLAMVATQDENAAELAWESLNDATSLENIGLCEAVYRALVKVKSKRKSFELSEAAREKLELLSRAQSERFAKFGAKF